MTFKEFMECLEIEDTTIVLVRFNGCDTFLDIKSGKSVFTMDMLKDYEVVYHRKVNNDTKQFLIELVQRR